MVLDFAHHVIECDEWSCLSSASSETGRRACLFSRDLIFIMIFSQLPCEVTHHVPIKQKQKKKKKQNWSPGHCNNLPEITQRVCQGARPEHLPHTRPWQYFKINLQLTTQLCYTFICSVLRVCFLKTYPSPSLLSPRALSSSLFCLLPCSFWRSPHPRPSQYKTKIGESRELPSGIPKFACIPYI